MPLLQAAIELIQLIPPGANAKSGANIKLCRGVIEDMVRFPEIGAIIVVGGDSEYVPLAYKVKAAGRTLVGIGSRHGTNQRWAGSCREFKFYEALLSPKTPPPSSAACPVPTEASAQAQPRPALPDLPLASDQVDSCRGLPAPAGGSAAESADVREIGALLDVVESGAAQRLDARDLVTKAITRLA